MEMVKIPHTDLEVSRLIAGCMDIGGGWGAGITITREVENEARTLVETALELGVNFFDHANIYAQGRAEEVFGRILKEKPSLRGQIVLQSKCGIRWAGEPAGSPQRFDFSRENIVAATEASLKRLQTEHLDILLLHRPDPLWEGEEVAEAFAELKKAGKVRYFGVSNQNRFQIEYLQSFLPDPLVANQVEMNLLHNGFAEAGISFNQSAPAYPDGWEGTIEYMRLHKVSVQAWSPLARGKLSGNTDGQPENVRKTAALVADYAAAKNTSTEAIVLAWLLRHPAKIQPVLGTKNPARFRACALADKVELSREEWYSLFAAARGASMP